MQGVKLEKIWVLKKILFLLYTMTVPIQYTGDTEDKYISRFIHTLLHKKL